MQHRKGINAAGPLDRISGDTLGVIRRQQRDGHWFYR